MGPRNVMISVVVAFQKPEENSYRMWCRMSVSVIQLSAGLILTMQSPAIIASSAICFKRLRLEAASFSNALSKTENKTKGVAAFKVMHSEPLVISKDQAIGLVLGVHDVVEISS
eukprot:Gregarina_sp_Pseudo_9__515@NODE_132_length_4096_cov_15_785309_g124_i0_p6_GENE_NODE_132_length_4096_cov_15_785309_g124_i0NODE_132_length_4096_cov_15_785309_g124_i0_p6_ORF_typecomplete_len114_score20_67DUF5099/PF17025_5/0_16SHS2_Rpb7N/PF03876_17/7_5e03SHS2_Rpb7N/PF03876_17/0_31_NODE_132_length_4096_cov_15_785309_g124_i026643005